MIKSPRVLSIASLLILIIALAPTATAQMVIQFPELTGPYEVGRTYRSFVDEDREEIFSAAEDDIREITTTIFYPAEPAEDAEPAPFVTEDRLDLTARGMGIPISILQGFQSHAFADAPALDDTFPVLLYSPGLPAQEITQFPLIEELASNGYVVVVTSHPYISSFSLLADGTEVVAGDNVVIDFFGPFSEGQEIVEETIFPAVVADQVFILDALEDFNAEDDLLAGRLDLTRVGAFGHSFGGAASLQVAAERDAVLAAMNLDGTMYGSVTEDGLDIPVTIARSAPFVPTDEMLEQQGMTREGVEAIETDFAMAADFILENAPVGYRFEVFDIAHNGYDTGLLIAAETIPFIGEDVIGSMEPEAARQVIFDYVLAFMNTYVAAGDATPTLADFDPGEVASLETFGE